MRVAGCCPKYIEVIIGVVGFDMDGALGMIIGSGMEERQESLEC